MGVPLLLTWLRKRFADCFLPADSQSTDYIRKGTDNLYIDLNSFLYQAATIITATHRTHRFNNANEVEDLVLRKLFDLLDDLVLNLVQPKALVYIAVDGVSPLGKMAQQRARRRRGARKGSSSSSGHHRPHSGGGGGERFDDDDRGVGNMGDLWDGNCISVGTRFMAKVTEALHFYAASRVERINVKRHRAAVAAAEGDETKEADTVEPITIIVDDVLRPGEGENKIAEAIRRSRTQPGYNANTSHVICSSDTDVTVSSLILHEPRIHVLRYEPPVSLGGKPPANPNSRPPLAVGGHRGGGGGFGRGGAGARGGGVGHRGRGSGRGAVGARGRGGGGRGFAFSGRGGAKAPVAASPPPPKDSWLSTFFSIHIFRKKLREILQVPDSTPVGTAEDEVSNDQLFENALHDVVFTLLLFGNDFLPTTGGSIQEGTLDMLLQLLATDFVARGRNIVHPSTNVIQYESARYLLGCLSDAAMEKKMNRGEGLRIHTGNDRGRGGDDWGFVDEEKAVLNAERAARQEKYHEQKCYCYWTMLQWALQYSAGIVEHWGCYYPYSSAPPLSKLSKYCGMLTNDALVELASRRSRRRKERVGQHGRGAVDDDDDEELDEDITSNPNNLVLKPAAHPSAAAAGVPTVEKGRPTDVMVQLLILIPPTSASLLPAGFRHHYKEIEQTVQAPVEQLDLAGISAWCEERKKALSEEERTRFDAYQFFSSHKLLYNPDSSTQESPLEAAPPATEGGRQKEPLLAEEAAFAAFWWPTDAQEEVVAEVRKTREAAKAGALGLGVPAPIVSAAQASAASFFGKRPGTASAAGVGGAAAAAALLAAAVIKDPPSRVPDSPLSLTKSGSWEEGSVASTTTAPAIVPRLLTAPKSQFQLWVAPCEVLKDPGMQKAMGRLNGNRFTVGAYVPSMDSEATLSRYVYTGHQRIRLSFGLVVVPRILDNTYAAGLLPGYVDPDEASLRERAEAAQRREQESQQDPWAATGEGDETSRKRAREEEGEEEEEEEDGNQCEDDDSGQVAEEAEEVPTEAPTETPEQALERKKKEMRDRLAVMKAGVNSQ